MCAVLVGAIGYIAGSYRTARWLRPFVSPTAAELQELADQYGPNRYSRNAEEWIVRDYFQGRRGGIFVDVGANHYRDDSNTYYLEKELGWRGIAVEPQTKFADDYRLHRPMTTFVPLFVSDVSNEHALLYVPANDKIASANKEFIATQSNDPSAAVTTNTATLDDILDSNGVEHIDFLSMDIELHEPQALKGFSVGRFRPHLVAIEAHMQVRQQILEFFTRNEYVIVGKYLRADSGNLWFARMDSIQAAADGR